MDESFLGFMVIIHFARLGLTPSNEKKQHAKQNMYMLTCMLTNQQKIKPIKVKKNMLLKLNAEKKQKLQNYTLFCLACNCLMTHILMK